MNKSLSKYLFAALIGFVSIPAVIAQDQDDISDRLALNMHIDPTTAFLPQMESMLNADRLSFDIVNYAKTFLGRPYRRGSKGPSAFDCSGFTSYVFKNFDISLNSSSRSQYLQGEKVELDEVRPGDLLFFSGRRGGKSIVGHVGMVVSVDDNGVVTFIHAATSGGVRYDKYPDGAYYSNRYIGAKRVIE